MTWREKKNSLNLEGCSFVSENDETWIFVPEKGCGKFEGENLTFFPSEKTFSSSRYYSAFPFSVFGTRCLLIFGGHLGNSFSANFQVFNLERKIFIDSPFLLKPTPRSGAATCLDSRRNIFLFGGRFLSTCMNDLYFLGKSALGWESVKQKGEIPSSRFGSTLIYFNSKLWLFGGSNGSSKFSDVFSFDLKSKIWQKIVYSGTFTPRSCFGHLIQGGKCFFVGGGTANLECFDFNKFEFSFVGTTPFSDSGSLTLQNRKVYFLSKDRIWSFNGPLPAAALPEIIPSSSIEPPLPDPTSPRRDQDFSRGDDDFSYDSDQESTQIPIRLDDEESDDEEIFEDLPPPPIPPRNNQELSKEESLRLIEVLQAENRLIRTQLRRAADHDRQKDLLIEKLRKMIQERDERIEQLERQISLWSSETEKFQEISQQAILELSQRYEVLSNQYRRTATELKQEIEHRVELERLLDEDSTSISSRGELSPRGHLSVYEEVF